MGSEDEKMVTDDFRVSTRSSTAGTSDEHLRPPDSEFVTSGQEAFNAYESLRRRRCGLIRKWKWGGLDQADKLIEVGDVLVWDLRDDERVRMNASCDMR
ncbi:unnamed protein product [Phytophthora fragariaefolia]|uniref:Unnamed protein product n=1 Tax=Phytophthora fragariaefolia TaxID=1490495 RepID=A0A9W6Y6P1_9STRA|nr:unnamed protein product [Phytophthora fragariaefolia]